MTIFYYIYIYIYIKLVCLYCLIYAFIKYIQVDIKILVI